MTVAVGSILTVDPAVWDKEAEFNTFPINRLWQWYRNGSPISGAVGASYTVTNADQGASITVVETAGFLNETIVTALNAPPVGTTSTATSVAVVADMGSVDSSLVYSGNVNYLGAFKMPTAGTGYLAIPDYAGKYLALRKNGGTSTLIVGGHVNENGAAEISIPASFTTPFVDEASLSASSLIYPASSGTALPRLAYSVNLSDIGVDPSNGVKTYGAYANNETGKLYFSAASFYTNSSVQLNYRRPMALSDTNQANLEGPFFFDGFSPRWSSGWYCKVPSTPVMNRNGVLTNYQTALGGDTLASLCGLSIINATSNGATATVFSDANVTTALTRVQSGVARGGSTNSIQLAVGASAVTVGDLIFCSSAANIAQYVSAFDNSTKIATISGTWTAPVSGASYNVIPKVAAKTLFGYFTNAGTYPTSVGDSLEPNQRTPSQQNQRIFNAIWNETTHYRGLCIPDGTRSLLFFHLAGDGFANYGPFTEQRNNNWLYSYGNDGSGPKAPPYQLKITAFDLDDLAEVAADLRGYNDIKPYGSWAFVIPGIDNPISERSTFSACAYDSTTKRVYVTHNFPSFGAPNAQKTIIHAFEITNAVIV
jgi:hypothetical protein